MMALMKHFGSTVEIVIFMILTLIEIWLIASDFQEVVAYRLCCQSFGTDLPEGAEKEVFREAT